MIFEKTTYRRIAFGFLILFLSLLIVPTVLVAAIDEDVNISMVFAFAEEETKEKEVKGNLTIDDFFRSNNLIPEIALVEIELAQFSYDKTFIGLHCLGIIVPPPKNS